MVVLEKYTILSHATIIPKNPSPTTYLRLYLQIALVRDHCPFLIYVNFANKSHLSFGV